MFVSARRIAESSGVAGPLVCYQGALVGDPVRRDRSRTIRSSLALAREILAALGEQGGVHATSSSRTASTCRATTSDARRYARSRASRCTSSATSRAGSPSPTTKIVTVGEPERARRSRRAWLPRFGRARVHRQVAAPVPGVRRAGRLQGASAASGVGELLGIRRPPTASRSATARTTSRCSSGPGSAWRSGRLHPSSSSCRLARAAVEEDGVPRSSRRWLPRAAADGLDPAHARPAPHPLSEPDAVRAALARRGDAALLDPALALDERTGARCRRASTSCAAAPQRRARPSSRRGQARGQGRSRRRAPGRRGDRRDARAQAHAAPTSSGCGGRRAARRGAAAAAEPAARVAPPLGIREEDAEVVRTVGEPPAFGFEPRDHLELAEGWIDMERGARTSGSRFAYLLGDVARLWLAIRQFALDPLSRARASRPVMPPVLVREEALSARASSRPTASRSTPSRDDDLYLVGTSEVLARGAAPGRDPAARPSCRCATAGSRRASGARPARRAATRAASSARTSSRRSRCSRSATRTARGTSTTGCSRSRRRSRRRSACTTAS